MLNPQQGWGVTRIKSLQTDLRKERLMCEIGMGDTYIVVEHTLQLKQFQNNKPAEVRSQNFQSLTFQGCGEIISGIATIQAKEDTLKHMKTP